MYRIYFSIVVSYLCVAPALWADDPIRTPYITFGSGSRTECVELEKTRGMIDLQKPFTVELWTRWDADVVDKPHYLAGDEAWPGMSDKVLVAALSGWVVRTTKLKDADKYAIEFNVAASARGSREWLSVATSYQRVESKVWQHIAICRTSKELWVFWNGKPAARQSLVGIELHSSPSNVFLGVRKHAWLDREFVGDIRAFRASSKARYGPKFMPLAFRETDDDTLLLLDLSGAEDAIVPDISGHGRNGTIIGAKLVGAKK